MAVPFVLPVEDNQEEISPRQLQIILSLYSELDRYIRSRTNLSTLTHVNNNQMAIGQSGLVLLDQDMTGLPLPDLVSSAIRQFQQAPAPRVTVSAPTSPTRDATFQFPECSSSTNVVSVATAAAAVAAAAATNNYDNENDRDIDEEEQEERAPVPTPTPRPRPRRNRPTNVRCVPFKKTLPTICNGDLSNNCSEYPSHVLRNEQFLIDIGSTLRKIAQDLQASKSKNNEVENLRLSLMASGFSNNTPNTNSNSEDIVGSLLPASFRETTLWVTVILYLGWTLISRLR